MTGDTATPPAPPPTTSGEVGVGADGGPPPPATDRRERVGWYFYDWANSAFSTTVVTAFLGPYLGSIAENGADANGDVSIFGLSFAAGSLFAYVVSVSVGLQVFLLPVVGAIADRSPRKKIWLAAFAYTGAGATMALIFLTGGRYELGAVLLLIANLSFGASVVVYNSYLPQIANEHERDGVSSRGWAFGYLGGGLLLLVNMIALLVGGDERTADIARWSLASAGLWWAGFTTFSMLWLRDRPPLAGLASGPVIIDGFRQFWKTLKGLRAYPLTLGFLAAFLIYNDGIQTVITMASVYGTKELGFGSATMLQTILIVQILAFGGALALGWLAKRFGAVKTVLGSLVGWTAIVVVAYFLPEQEVIPLFAVGAAIGIVLGGSQALSRSLFSQLIPKGKEGEYFGLYEISDRGTSWLGPALFGAAYDITGSYRVAIVSLIIFFAVGFVGLLFVPMRRAIIAAGNTPPAKL